MKKSKTDKTDLLQGTLDLIILKMLQTGPANGYEITQRIRVISKEVLSLNYGSLYPALHRLVARGWITSAWGVSDNNRRAKYYQLTSAGRKQLAVERQAWERFADALAAILRTA
ncbi:MAG TPA: PadR family transcriptional regulator [Blastocatellia bacterium]|nr:PadR family transcriptional regulator [Blastocatellia bacterium]